MLNSIQGVMIAKRIRGNEERNRKVGKEDGKKKVRKSGFAVVHLDT